MCWFPDSASSFLPIHFTFADCSYLLNTIRANRMQRFIMQMAVHYLLKSDFCFIFPIKFKFKDSALHFPCNFAEAKYAPLHTLLCSTIHVILHAHSFDRCGTSGRVRFSEYAQRIHFLLSANQISQIWLWGCAEWHEVRDSWTFGVGPSRRLLFLVPCDQKERGLCEDENAWRPKSNWSLHNGYVTRLERRKNQTHWHHQQLTFYIPYCYYHQNQFPLACCAHVMQHKIVELKTNIMKHYLWI